MKKIILLAALALFGMAANAQTSKKTSKKNIPVKETQAKVITPQVDGAGMVFETETIDYGNIPVNSDGTREFIFTNIGNKTLIIETVQTSCSCMVASKPSEPIPPGGKGIIKVKYDTRRVGRFIKTATVKSNAVGQETKILTIKGEVLPAPAEEPTPSKN